MTEVEEILEKKFLEAYKEITEEENINGAIQPIKKAQMDEAEENLIERTKEWVKNQKNIEEMFDGE